MVDLFSTIVDYIVEQNRENNLQIVHLFSWNSPQKDYIIIHSKLFFSSLSYFLVFSFPRSLCEKWSLIVCYSVRKFIFNFYTISIIFKNCMQILQINKAQTSWFLLNHLYIQQNYCIMQEAIKSWTLTNCILRNFNYYVLQNHKPKLIKTLFLVKLQISINITTPETKTICVHNLIYYSIKVQNWSKFFHTPCYYNTLNPTTQL